MAERRIVFVVSSPSGGGKGTILADVFQRDSRLRHAVSATTRSPREGEVDGTHYHFLDTRRFKDWIAEGRFAEWATVHDEYYGTLKSELDDILNSGFDVVLELDVQGMRSISQQRDDVVSIFILPPSIEVLEERLRGRGGLSEENLQRRLKNAEGEIRAKKEYGYTVLNDILEDAVKTFETILSEAREKAINRA
ncbi:MAG: guanylate kinase [Candidatus Hydrogenedentes bacterium]|nr:guanylate kinase [Candidatus Hydrogenedentota bacterium]